MSYLGIDVGTSALKLVVIDEQQQCLAQTSVSLNIYRPQPLWSEQNPEEWWQALEKAFDETKAKDPKLLAQVEAIGLTGQMHGAVCLDKDNQVLRPAILWNDGRSYHECDILNEHFANFKQINGNTVMPGFTAPKLLWIKHHESEIFAKIHKVLLPKDFVRFKLSGDYASDLSDAAGTSWLDVGNRRWSKSLLEATNLTIDHMPRVYEGIEITGELLPELAQRWGMPKRVKIVAGAGDNAAGAISIGVVDSSHAMLSIGTSGVYFVPTDKFVFSPEGTFHTFCHCLPNKWHQMGVILSAASSLSWWSTVNAVKEADLINEAEHATLKDVPLFLPYLSGERTPHNDPFAQGVFFGMTHNTTRAELTQSILEGVAFALADCQKVLKQAGAEAEHISVIGGGAQSKYWGQIIANILNKPLSYHDESLLGPSFGAARLAIIGSRQAPISVVAKIPKATEIINPISQARQLYVDRFAKYTKIYQQLKSLFKR